MPCAVPPSIWPIAIIGWIALPISATAVTFIGVTSKVSRIDLDLDDVAAPRVAAVRIARDSSRRPTADPGGGSYCSVTVNEPCLLEVLRGRQLAERVAHLRAQRSSSLPTTMHVRDATVGPLSGTNAVSASLHVDRVVRHAERVGDDLRVHRARALADLGAGDEDARAARRQLERRLRRELDFAARR